MILDSVNEKVTAYNLTDHDLAVETNYDELKALLRATATAVAAR